MAQRKWVVDREFEIGGNVFPVGMEFTASRLKKEVREYLERRKCVHVEGDEEEEGEAKTVAPRGGHIEYTLPFNYQEGTDGEDQ
jgi:hypothetical protein